MKTTGTIIGRIPLQDTSLIVQWCTEDKGIIKTVARGARKPKSPFSGKIDLFFRCEIEVHPAKKGDLHTLKELIILNSRFGLRRNYRQTQAASYFVKLIEKAAEPEAPVPEFDDLLNRALNYLDQKDIDFRAMLHFEKQLSEILGIHDPDQEPHLLLMNHFSGLPKQREELISLLEKDSR